MASAHDHVAQHVHRQRSHARARVSGAPRKAPAQPLTFQKGELVIDTQTGQEGVVLRGKKKHVPTPAPRG